MKDYTFKVANMKKAQEFTLYPYTGGDFIYLQIEPIKCQLPEDIKTEIQGFLWHNEGKDGNINNVLHFENKPLFSETASFKTTGNLTLLSNAD